MGLYLLDQYSLLHFAVGIIAYFWGIGWFILLLLHILFELSENTTWGIHFINQYITIWPGGKPYPDSYINQLSDTLASMLGWIVSYYTDKYSDEHHLYRI